MSAIQPSLPQPAFTPAPITSWTSIATRQSPARNGNSLKSSRLAKGIVVRPGQTRRSGVSRRQGTLDPFRFTSEPATPQPRRATQPPQQSPKSSKRHTLSPSAQPESVPGELIRELHGEDGNSKEAKGIATQDSTLMDERVSEAVVKRLDEMKGERKPLTTPTLSEDERITQRKQRKEKAQQAYLTEQLEKRQFENLAKKATVEKSQSKTQKRVRATSRSRLSASSALKDSFQAYMSEISREELLGHAEIIMLANRIKDSVAVESAKQSLQHELGRRPTVPELAKSLSITPQELQKRLMAGTAAKNTLVSANLRLVTSVARKVAAGKSTTKAGLALEDMVQEGSVGLIRAAEKFDAARGYKFSTYATWWIRAYVMRSISTQSRSIKVPSTIVDEYSRIQKEYTRLRESGNFRPRDSEVARGLGITPAKLRFVVNVVTREPASLDIRLSASGDQNNSRTLGEVVEGGDHIEERMVEDLARKELDEALRGCLKPLERAVIRLRFGLEDGQSRTLRETGALLGLSKERIRQIIFRALPKMKTPEIQRMLTDATAR